jgi:hypothetical protein
VRVTVEQVVAAPAARDNVRRVEDPRSREARGYRLLRAHVIDRELKPSLKRLTCRVRNRRMRSRTRRGLGARSRVERGRPSACRGVSGLRLDTSRRAAFRSSRSSPVRSPRTSSNQTRGAPTSRAAVARSWIEKWSVGSTRHQLILSSVTAPTQHPMPIVIDGPDRIAVLNAIDKFNSADDSTRRGVALPCPLHWFSQIGRHRPDIHVLVVGTLEADVDGKSATEAGALTPVLDVLCAHDD